MTDFKTKVVRIVDDSIIDSDKWSTELFERELEMAREQLRAKLRKEGIDESWADYVDEWVGGSDYCVCSGCATHLNEVFYGSYDGVFTIWINFSMEDAREIKSIREG